MAQQAQARDLGRRHRAVALWCAGLVVGHGRRRLRRRAALPPVLPGDGLRRHAAHRRGTPSTQVLDKTITIRFDANVAPGLGWRFEPVHTTCRSRSARTRSPSTAPPTPPTGPCGAWRPSTCCPSRPPSSSTSSSASASRSSCCSRARAWRCRSASSSTRRSSSDKDARGVTAHHAVLHVLSRRPEAGDRRDAGRGNRACGTGDSAARRPGRLGKEQRGSEGHPRRGGRRDQGAGSMADTHAKHHDYHLVNPSPWPAVGATARPSSPRSA